MFNMFILVVNAILFSVFFIVFASRIYKLFLLCRIFLMSGDLGLSVSLLCFVIINCFVALMLERWKVRRRESVVVVRPI